MLTAELEKPSINVDQVYDVNAETAIIITKAFFRSDATPVLNSSKIVQKVSKARRKIMDSLEQFTNEGSGWRLKLCIALDLKIAQYRPFRGQSYIKTPSYIPPRTVINVKNEDNRCFEWAILSALYPVDKHTDRKSKYRDHIGELKFDGIDFPVKVTDIDKFERQNKDLSVSVFGWNKGLYPLHVSKQQGKDIDLLC